MVEFTRWKSF